MLLGVKTLLQGLLNSNSHGNGHTDHGVVTGAQGSEDLVLGAGHILHDFGNSAVKNSAQVVDGGCGDGFVFPEFIQSGT